MKQEYLVNGIAEGLNIKQSVPFVFIFSFQSQYFVKSKQFGLHL